MSVTEMTFPDEEQTKHHLARPGKANVCAAEGHGKARWKGIDFSRGR
jgi:hypothetical protein